MDADGSKSLGESALTNEESNYSSKRYWSILVVLGLALSGGGVSSSLQMPFFPAEANKKGATSQEYGIVFGIFQLTILVSSPLVVKMFRCAYPKSMLLCGMIALGFSSIGFGAVSLVNSSTSFIVTASVIRIVEGLGFSLCMSACFTITSSQFPAKVGTSTALLDICYSLGLILGPTLGGLLFEAGGFSLPFYTTGAFILLDTIVVSIVLPKGVKESKDVSEKPSALKFWNHRMTAKYALCILSTYIVIGFNDATLEPHIRKFHLTPTQFGLILLLGGGLFAMASYPVGWLCDKKNYIEVTLFVGCGTMMAGFIFLAPAPFTNLEESMKSVYIAISCQALAYSLKLVPAMTGLVRDTLKRGFPDEVKTHALTTSVYTIMSSLGGFLGPTAGGVLVENIGYKNSTMILILIEILVAIYSVSILIFEKCHGVKKSIALSVEEQGKKHSFPCNVQNGVLTLSVNKK